VRNPLGAIRGAAQLLARAGGSGLGLTVANSVAREHGGELGFDSRAGCTRFWLRMPLQKQG